MRTRQHALAWLGAVAVAALPCCAPVTRDGPAELAPLEPCAALASGDLDLPGIEGALGYDEALAALDLASLPASIALGSLSAFDRGLVRYMLDEADSDIVDTAAARGTPLGRAVLGAFVSGAAREDGGMDGDMLRRGLHRFYACERALPLTLASFNATVADVSALPVAETVQSHVKGLPRRMRRSARDGVFVAETLVAGPRGDVVRETEILLTDRRRDGALDFLEYDAAGDLRGASRFAPGDGSSAQVVGAVPISCIGCHGFRDVTPAPS